MDYVLAAQIALVGMSMVFMVLIAVGIVIRLTSIVVEKLEGENS